MPVDTVDDPRQIIADLQRELAQRTAERDEALARETATAEVLGVINSSPGDLAPVFDAMLDKALSLCDASYGSMYTYDGEQFHPVARQCTFYLAWVGAHQTAPDIIWICSAPFPGWFCYWQPMSCTAGFQTDALPT